MLSVLPLAALLFFASLILASILIPGAHRFWPEVLVVPGLVTFALTSQHVLRRRAHKVWTLTLFLLIIGWWTILAIRGSSPGRFFVYVVLGTLGFAAPIALKVIIDIVRHILRRDAFISYPDFVNLLLAYLYWLVSCACLFTFFQLVPPLDFEIQHPTVLFVDMLYFASVTFTTLGYGDVTPITLQAKVLLIVFNLGYFSWRDLVSVVSSRVSRQDQMGKVHEKSRAGQPRRSSGRIPRFSARPRRSSA